MNSYATTAGTELVLNLLRVLPVSGGGIGLITAPAVAGKTWAIEAAREALGYVRRVDPTPAAAGSSPRAFYRELAVRLELPVRGCDGATDLEMMIEQHVRGGRLLLVIDQCEEMPGSWLPCLRHLADALGCLVLSGRGTFLDRLVADAGLAGRVRLPVALPVPTLEEIAGYYEEEFDQEFLAETYTLNDGRWGAIASVVGLERTQSAGLARPTREARAEDARRLSKKVLRAVA